MILNIKIYRYIRNVISALRSTIAKNLFKGIQTVLNCLCYSLQELLRALAVTQRFFIVCTPYDKFSVIHSLHSTSDIGACNRYTSGNTPVGSRTCPSSGRGTQVLFLGTFSFFFFVSLFLVIASVLFPFFFLLSFKPITKAKNKQHERN